MPHVEVERRFPTLQEMFDGSPVDCWRVFCSKVDPILTERYHRAGVVGMNNGRFYLQSGEILTMEELEQRVK